MIPALGAIAPPPGTVGAVIATLQVFMAATSYHAETTQPTEYSKFALGKQLDKPISSQNGMFRIYVPSTLAAVGHTMYTLLAASESFSWVTLMLLVHFLKRTLEVAFLHEYSGQMPAKNANFIGFYYTLVTLLVALTAVPNAEVMEPGLLGIGMALFTVGELGNLYHHWLLKTLRQRSGVDKETRRYLPPTGGLFEYVATPHYLFELFAWLGMACVAQQMNAFLTFATMSSYLAGRAVQTNQMYKSQFSKEEWPAEQKALVPFIF